MAHGRRQNRLRGLVVLGLACGALGMHLLCSDLRGARRYQDLGEQVHVELREAAAANGAAAIDWDALRAQNEDVVAWARVEGTGVDHPVVRAPAGEPDFYLDHNLWGECSRDGCPFLDHRSEAEGPHALAYAHHLAGTHAQFSDLFACHRQEEFDRLGDLLWSTPAAGETRMAPLCALTVDSSWEPIQRFSFEDEAALRSWLADLCTQATARAPDHVARAARATRAVTLVTCSSLAPGQDARTLVVFAC